MATDLPEDDSVLRPGPWRHRTVRANGIALHTAELGEGPLVVLVHGFPEFWWTWRQQLVDLADAGFRAVAVDLRGYGASDKPPRGYDAPTLTGDVAGLVTALGHRDAVFVGSGIGGLLAWAAGSLQPDVVRSIVVLGAAHPRRLRHAVFTDPAGQGRASSYAWSGFQLPRRPEWTLTKQPGYVRSLFDRWAGPQWRASEDYETATEVYAAAMRIHPVAHLSLEAFRWMVRSIPRGDGRGYMHALRNPITAPVLQLHGEFDSCVLPSTAQGSGRYVTGEYEWRSVAGAGHFLQEEAPGLVSGEIIRWAKG